MQLLTSAPAGPLALDDCFVMAMRAAIARTRFDRATVEFENISNYTFPAFYNLYLDELIDVGDARVLTRGARRADHAAYVLSRRCARIDARRLRAAADACFPDSRFRGEDGSTRRPPSAGALRFAARMPSVRVVLRRGALRRRPCRDFPARGGRRDSAISHCPLSEGESRRSLGATRSGYATARCAASRLCLSSDEG